MTRFEYDQDTTTYVAKDRRRSVVRACSAHRELARGLGPVKFMRLALDGGPADACAGQRCRIRPGHRDVSDRYTTSRYFDYHIAVWEANALVAPELARVVQEYLDHLEELDGRLAAAETGMAALRMERSRVEAELELRFDSVSYSEDYAAARMR